MVREFARQLLRAVPASLDLAAQLAYFAILAIFPGAMFLLTVIGYLPLSGVEALVASSLHAMLPDEVAALFLTTLSEIMGQQHGWLLLSTLAIAVWAGSDVANGLTTALNRAHGVVETRPFLRVRLRAVLVTLGCGIQIFIATAALSIGPDVVRRVWSLFGLAGAFDELWALVRWPVALLAMMTMTACAYYFLPNVRQRWRLFSPGATVAVLAWLGLSQGFRLWVTHFPSQAKAYGALGTVILLLIWLYWSSVMIILGGEVNAIVDRMRAHAPRRLQPA